MNVVDPGGEYPVELTPDSFEWAQLSWLEVAVLTSLKYLVAWIWGFACVATVEYYFIPLQYKVYFYLVNFAWLFVLLHDMLTTLSEVMKNYYGGSK